MLRIDHNIDALRRDLSDIGRKQLPYAMARAANETGALVLTAIERGIKTDFDRPTRFTQRAFFWRRANTRAGVGGSVERRFAPGRKDYLETQEAGGTRRKTALEGMLGGRYGGVGFVAPAWRAPLNSFGNLSGGLLNQMLSQLGAQRDAAANQTDASKKRAGKRRAEFFIPKPGQLSRGVWRRQGKSLRKVLNFDIKAPTYRKRFDFYGRATRVADRFFGRKLEKWLAEAIRTARR